MPYDNEGNAGPQNNIMGILDIVLKRGICCKFQVFYSVVCEKFYFRIFVYSSRPWEIRVVAFWMCVRYCGGRNLRDIVVSVIFFT